MKQFPKLVAKPPQRSQSLPRSLDHFVLGLKYFPSAAFREHAHHFAHAPPRRSKDLQSIHPWHQERYAAVASHANTLRITLKCLEFKSRQINSLELFGGVSHKLKFPVAGESSS
jgi:hypothetical protein